MGEEGEAPGPRRITSDQLKSPTFDHDGIRIRERDGIQETSEFGIRGRTDHPRDRDRCEHRGSRTKRAGSRNHHSHHSRGTGPHAR
jgi:hypothetical protein